MARHQGSGAIARLNAPSGAGCFLTYRVDSGRLFGDGLNAPSGAGCFLTASDEEEE